MRHIVLSVCAACLLAACNTADKQGIATSVVKGTDGNELTVCHYQDVSDTIEMKLSELVEDCRIVRFEDNDSALLGFRVFPTFTDHYIGMTQEHKPYLLFDKDGKFLCNVGGVGNGPGEYAMSIYDAAIDEQAGEVYLGIFAAQSKIMVYGLDGKLVRENVVSQHLNKPKLKMDAEGCLNVLHIPFLSQEPHTMAYRFDREGNLMQTLEVDEHLCAENFNQDLFAYDNVPDFAFHLTSCDTLFHYEAAGNRIVPKYTIDFGLMDEKPVHIYNELPFHYWTVVFGVGTIVTDKQKLNSHYVRLVNDFYGGLKNSFVFQDGYAFSMLEPGRLIYRIEQRLKEKDCSEADRQLLEELLQSVDEEGNNIMFVGKLKR